MEDCATRLQKLEEMILHLEESMEKVLVFCESIDGTVNPRLNFAFTEVIDTPGRRL